MKLRRGIKKKTARRLTPRVSVLRKKPASSRQREHSDKDPETIDHLKRELEEALEQQAATAEVLKIISSSAGALDPVFRTILANATRLCGAKFGTLYLRDGNAFRAAAFHNAPPAFIEDRKNRLIEPASGTTLGRAAKTKQVAQILDSTKREAYRQGDPFVVAGADLGGYRTIVSVPMLKEDELVGVISIYRQEVLAFSDKQIELVSNFAAQAVIAIENTRLLNELRESLQQQTATADVLKVISRSTFDLQTVLNTLVESATRLCEADHAWLFERDDEILRFRASFGHATEVHEEISNFFRPRKIAIDRGSVAGRTALEGKLVHLPDVLADREYTWGGAQKIGGYRAALGVPLLREGNVAGVLFIAKTVPQPFTGKQIELATTFADQAVIAIENTRLFGELQNRTNDLTESLQQQTATSDVLRVISRSPTNIQPVLDAILETAGRLCESEYALFFRLHDGKYHLAGSNNAKADYIKYLSEHPISIDRGTVIGRTAVERHVVHIPDCLADPEYTAHEYARTGKHRSMLGVPLLRDGEPIGVIGLLRTSVRPYTDKQIELVTTFADQAVIAIENVRLFDEVQSRTRDLTESLEQQTATSEVLKVISSSLNDLKPVFATIGQRAEKLCEAEISVISMVDGDLIRLVSINGIAEEGVEIVRRAYPMQLNGETVTARAIRTSTVCHVADVLGDPLYQNKDAARVSGFRGCLAVPMVRDEQVVGAIFVARREVGLFADAQVALLRTFADQAVIAIENVRLFNETKEALEQQTATADVLKVISRSTFDLQTVLQTLVESAARLCDAEQGTITRQVDGKFYRAATYGFSAEFTEMVRDVPVEIERGSATGRALVEGKVIHIPDVRADADYTFDQAIKLGEFRTIIAIPMLREGVAIGVLTLTRKEVRPFAEREFELVTTFSDQAAIAIENVRLFDEVQSRTEELTESLRQQTATSDVLKVISRSTFDLQTVLDTLVESASRLCEADMASINRERDGVYRQAASYGFTAEMQAYVSNHPIAAGQGSIVGRAVMDGATIHIPDVLADPEYKMTEAATLGGVHTMLGVPLLREGTPIGVIVLQRKAVRPFTDKQVELVETFADQAVIAIENVRLFNSVETRTRELAASLENLRTAQDRLVQTEKLASLGQLTAGIAHEIKNPLNFVNNFSGISAELIDELQETLGGISIDKKTRAEITELTDTLRGNLEKVVQHGKRADSIVKNMLLHSRSGSGDHRPVEINAVVEESLNLAYHGARAEKQGFNITLERSFDPAAGEVDVFPQEITRVLLNLIANGFYAATKRKGQAGADGYEPTLAAATKDLGDRVEIRIRDNGTGIPPDVKDKMFNPFFTTKPAGEGTGLGLSISHDIIVKQHAGSIEVDTQPGEFTEFRIILPRTAASLAKSGA
ncbi:MAG: GAF domain-containing protein [Pseudolabrys sp.]